MPEPDDLCICGHVRRLHAREDDSRTVPYCRQCYNLPLNQRSEACGGFQLAVIQPYSEARP